MATAVLKADTGKEHALLWKSIGNNEEAKAELAPLMNFSRNAPPPQLPQILVHAWSRVWDMLVDILAEDVVKGKELQKIMPFHLCICCCGPCIVMPKMFAFNKDQTERWCAMLSQIRPLLEPHGIGVSIEEEVSINSTGTGSDRHVSSNKTKVGLRFDGASMGAMGVPAPVGAMGMPVQAVPMGAMGMPAPSQVTMPMAKQTVAEKLRDLKQLRDDEILSELEFEQKKAQVLSLM